MRDDHSVHISGSSLSGGQINTGDHVTMNQAAQGASAELAGAFDRVVELLERYAAEVPEAARARRDLGEVREEAESADPDVPRRDGALARLTHRVAAVSPLLAAVETVRNLLP
ncbi:DUF5955 family protein [Actinocorallia sp. A-T 12471]|uniref:DUF5955 family protein n=1 Tax=Actinocorallia sp. A-T 12471 TaxID=3089813 RepID=UPI0029CE845C|nr:DUF5955 family protein [Actinocorallia sp. A-T 12471]MDX6738465.1 DUF5955 family protein [Actinocorallia sp. A-T 12471]